MPRIDMSHTRVEKCSFVSCVLADGTITHANVSSSDFSSSDVSNVNVSHAQLHECVFPNSNLHTAQWARAKITGGAKVAKPFKSLGFACSEVRSLGLVEGLKQAGYSCAEAKQA
eukprot:6577720-Prymnesium_polylepis.1